MSEISKNPTGRDEELVRSSVAIYRRTLDSIKMRGESSETVRWVLDAVFLLFAEACQGLRGAFTPAECRMLIQALATARHDPYNSLLLAERFAVVAHSQGLGSEGEVKALAAKLGALRDIERLAVIDAVVRHQVGDSDNPATLFDPPYIA